MSELTPEQAACRQRTDEEAAALAGTLRVSRPCRAEDLELFMPDASGEEMEAFLAARRGHGDVVTFAESIIDGRSVAGMMIGPPGSEKYLRRPGGARP